MMLLIFCGFLTLAAAAHNQKMIYSRNDGDTVTAVSFIRPNSKPPPDIKTKVSGTIKMVQSVGQDIIINVNISGLPSNTVHGFHIHEFGDTVTDGCQSTGGHYNPFHHTHGGPDDKKDSRHVGDLGNVESDNQGRIVIQLKDKLVSLFGPHSVFGRAFVIHEKRDDLGKGTGAAKAESLKTGNAGARLGCGVIFHD